MNPFNSPAPCSRPQCRLSDECVHTGELCQPESEFMALVKDWVEGQNLGLRGMLIMPLFEQYFRMWLAGLDIKPVVVALDQILRSANKQFYRRF